MTPLDAQTPPPLRPGRTAGPCRPTAPCDRGENATRRRGGRLSWVGAPEAVAARRGLHVDYAAAGPRPARIPARTPRRSGPS